MVQKLSVVLFIIIGVFLLLAVADMPEFGSPDIPSNNSLTSYYYENGIKDTGSENTVVSIILDYRGFDTFGENIVLFSAIASVIAALL
jgi:multicomponent Na+:H+ antiporter subunit B